MKKALTFTLFVFIGFSIQAQDYKANIKQRFTEYNNYIVAGEFDKSMNYIPEAVFTIVPRTQMVVLFEQVMKNKEFEARILGFDIRDIADRRKIDTCYYAKIKYVSSMTMKMYSDKEESAEAKKSRLALTTAAFSNTFGSDHVKLDESTETFTITPNKSSWAISKNGQTDWKFVNVEPRQRILMEKILPKALIEESLN